ncbi:sigma-70 family RNA polymerase sigma factor [Streptomyces sp. NPDC019990]|uniref:sigma-70 family RNA polymerase sigma factor n=1 Tax=Streptomyces sp. NPDC019990 TaxID=3154693 RepID=UPI0033EA269F
MSVDGRDESSGDGDATAGGPVPPRVPGQGGRAGVPSGGHPADATVPPQRERRDGAPPHEPQPYEPPRQEPPPSDGELIDRMRSGDDTAYEELYRRHAQAVRRYALTCCRDAHTADDLTAEVFARVLQAVRGGSGPEHAVRAYLLTSVRRVAASWTRSARREQLVDDFAVFAARSARAADLPGDDPFDLGADVRAMREAERSMAMRAFRSLPERWQAVLWHTEVEDESPSEVATLFGLDPNGTRVLASRAREGLKQAYLQAHVSAALTADGECARYADRLGTYARGRLRTRAERGLRKHLVGCAKCRLAALQIEEVAGGIPAVVPVAVIGWFGAAGYAKAAGLIAGGTGAGAAGAVAAAGGGSSGGAGSGGGVGSGGGAAACEGVGAPVKAGIAAGVVAVGVVTVVAMVLAGDEQPQREAKTPPAPSSPAVRPGVPAPSPAQREPAPPRPPALTPVRAETPAPGRGTGSAPPRSPAPTPDPLARSGPSRPAPPAPAPTRTPTPQPPPPTAALHPWSEPSYDLSGDGTEPGTRVGSGSCAGQRISLSADATLKLGEVSSTHLTLGRAESTVTCGQRAGGSVV